MLKNYVRQKNVECTLIYWKLSLKIIYGDDTGTFTDTDIDTDTDTDTSYILRPKVHCEIF